jgi:sarcosine oxidase
MRDANYDVIVLGVGGMGSAALFELARRGRSVLGIEQFGLVHDRGSSHGQTRIIRKAYAEHPDYVPLLRRAYDRWYELEQLQGRRLFTECGCLQIGRPQSSLVAGVLASATTHGLPIEMLGREQVHRRYPAFRLDEDMVAVLEHEAGFLDVEECVRAHIDQARIFGAEVRCGEPVHSWEAGPEQVTVRTDAGVYHAAHLVLTAGPWAPRLLAAWGAPLRVMRQVPLWFETREPRRLRRDVFPTFIVDTGLEHYYGFPAINPLGLKVARHYGAPELESPEQIERTVTVADVKPVSLFLQQYLRGAALSYMTWSGQVCTYTLTPDRHFIVDRHPEHANVVIAAGFSGHGFKFASVIGEIMADLVESGRTSLPIELFRIDRFQGVKG